MVEEIFDVAEEIAQKQRSISVTEFFEKNRHLLGFENKQKALLTCVKEALDNSLDACEEQAYSQIKKGLKPELPEIFVQVEKVSEDYQILSQDKLVGILSISDKNVNFSYHGKDITKEKKEKISFEYEDGSFNIIISEDKVSIQPNNFSLKKKSPRYKITILDNGPGIVEEKMPFIFGKMLYGSKFHMMKQSRGQQGIGIHAAVLYSQLTTGKPVTVISKTLKGKAIKMQIGVDTIKNEPIIYSREEVKDFPYEHGTKIELEIEGIYVAGSKGVDEYIKRTALVNPASTIIYINPLGQKFKYERVTTSLPPEPKAIKPHPQGLELGSFIRLMKESKEKSILRALEEELSRVSKNIAEETLKSVGIDPKTSPKEISTDMYDKILKALQSLDLLRPPTDCLSPIGKELIEKSLKAEFSPDFVYAVTRKPEVYRGIPFLIEVGLAYGGKITLQKAELMRFANRIPLLSDASSCAITAAFSAIDFSRYNLQVEGKVPLGPLVVLVHIASVWVPYTSEGKSAVAKYPVIMNEIKLGLQEALRELALYLGRQNRKRMFEEKISLFNKYSVELVEDLAKLTDKDEKLIKASVDKLLESRRKQIEESVTKSLEDGKESTR
ncbi:MAG: DNA topoisomerase VI subunit B [Candidatus Rehaiarchaeum fermentans]|nr:DNA topoisomerase VI subunit B [Candidatus Rehaiarchaeum fermentans]MCW1297180.1 DNA topoisomerase VI subunit B [Candidatus Rehaiarchaeum fermentans]MCW1302075.1 DNA topoisomerase VI subunit B [Candidatus Rehaiarchaeum fermentans]